MKTLRRLVAEITGKELVSVKVEAWFYQYADTIEVPSGRGRKEGVIHEVCHWVMAEDWQREANNNLGYGHSSDGAFDRDPRCTKSMMEHQELLTCHLQRMLYQFAGLTSPTSSPSCRKSRVTYAMTPEDVQLVLERAGDVGWQPLLELARARR